MKRQFSFKTIDILQMQQCVSSFEQQIVLVGQNLAEIYERHENWREAADALVLVRIPIESGEKLEKFLLQHN